MFNRFAAGRKVYGQGSPAPTRGPVNPAGYVKREAAKKAKGSARFTGGPTGRDGKSDRRSGFAQGMIRQVNNQALGMSGGQAPIRRDRQFGLADRFQKDQQAQAQAPKGPPVSTPGVGPAGGGAPGIQINPVGQLQLPYGSEFARQALDAQSEFDREMMDLSADQQAWDLDYQRQSRTLDQSFGQQQKATLNDNAASGTAFSSAYGVGVNEDTRAYTNMKNDMTAENNMFLGQVASRRGAAKAGLDGFLQQLTQAYADELAAQAGELGYGVDGAEDIAGASSVPGRSGVPLPHAGRPGKLGSALVHPTIPRGHKPPRSIPKNYGGGGGGNNNDNRPPRPSPNHKWNGNRWVKK